MTNYSPLPTVSISGVDYTSDTVNSVQITTGRTSVDEQPRAGFATIRLLVLDGAYPPINLNDTAQVNILESNGSDPHIFTGYVTDVSRSIAAHGAQGSTIALDVTVTGPLARLAKFTTSAAYPKQYDGDRMAAILADVFTTSWDEVTPTLTWSAVNPARTWLTYDPDTYVGSVDQPGAYELYAYSEGKKEAQSVTAAVASSALGVLWEDADGRINYDDITHRIDNVSTNGYTSIDAGLIQAVGTSTKTSTSNLINRMSITYKNNATASDEDGDSIATYGLFAGQRSTYLEAQASAEQQLALFLETRAQPRINVQAVTIPLHNPSMSDTLRDALIGVYNGMPISIPNLPGGIYDQPFAGFVEGYSWQVAKQTAFLTLTLSDYGLTAIQQAWNQVISTLRWQNVTATLTWENARTVI